MAETNKKEETVESRPSRADIQVRENGYTLEVWRSKGPNAVYVAKDAEELSEVIDRVLQIPEGL